MRVIVSFVLLVSAALLVIITLGGWERLQSPGVGLMTIAWAALYVLFAFLVLRWNRGLLPVASAMAIIMVIFAAVAANGWFARAKDGLDSPALPEDLNVFSLAMELGDRVYARSVQQHGHITPRLAEEGMRVFDAYLGLYLPHCLPKRDAIQDA